MYTVAHIMYTITLAMSCLQIYDDSTTLMRRIFTIFCELISKYFHYKSGCQTFKINNTLILLSPHTRTRIHIL